MTSSRHVSFILILERLSDLVCSSRSLLMKWRMLGNTMLRRITGEIKTKNGINIIMVVVIILILKQADLPLQ